MMDIADLAIQGGGLCFENITSFLHITDPLVKKYVQYQTNQIAQVYLILLL
jgi:hypothetical protein